MNLAPVSPAEADFTDLVPEANASNANLVPVTPKEASFDDDTITESVNSEESPILLPTTPKEAGFEDSI